MASLKYQKRISITAIAADIKEEKRYAKLCASFAVKPAFP
jgi:hypothetical protein